MKLILFVIIFTCILAIRFFAFIMKSAFDTAQIINERPRNTISKRYDDSDDPLLVDVINIARQNNCFNFSQNSYEEFLFALEIYIFLISYIGFFMCKKEIHLNNLVTIYSKNIENYIKNNKKKVNFSSAKTFYAINYHLESYYNIDNITQLILSRCKNYHLYLKDFYNEPAASPDYIAFFLNLAFELRDFLYENMQNDKLCRENACKNIIESEENNEKLVEIIMGVKMIADNIIADLANKYY